jgi:hypothetical protein
VREVLLVNEWEHMNKTSCGQVGGAGPVFQNNATTFEVPKACVAIATLRWELLPNGSQGSMALGETKSADGKIVLDFEGRQRHHGDIRI